MYEPIHLRGVDHPLRIALILGVALVACEPDQGPAADGGAPVVDEGPDAMGDPPCRAGQSRPCVVEDGCTGSQRCVDGVFEPCAADPEVCDDADQDCDGRIDEDVEGVGDECEFIRGTCRAPGIRRCDGPTMRLVCTPIAGEMPPEMCNGVDDDCDGATDEDIAPTPCVAGAGACRSDGQALCQGGRMVCGAEAGLPGEEVCNGVDDDCDGPVDEMPTDVGRACGTGLPGVCAAGRRICEAGAPVCAPDTPATDEVCNGLDDDCDGAVDEVFGVGALCTAGDGGCAREGTIRCIDGVGACDATPGAPTAEVCNGLDDDCDGALDEQPRQDEACNGGDDDCDGLIDEGFALGEPCEEGEGACRTDGVTVCGPRDTVVCGAVPGDPRDEVCNGVDDDCDGAPDEGLLVGDPCEVGVGACLRVGEGICGDDGPAVCSAEPGAPVREVCNGIDDDCDGTTDEGFAVGSPCSAGIGECQTEGQRVCADERLVCDAVAGEAQDERCDMLDNDCDGAVDEEFPLGAACEVGVGACRARGEFVCDGNGGLTCGAVPGERQVEVCNDVDDDCDGDVDEVEGVGRRCAIGIGLCARDGRQACGDGGALVCVGEPGQPTDELCDGEDQDCDGAADEDFPLGEPCSVGVGGCAREAVWVCDDNGGARCDAVPDAPAAELCDAVDNDCDGAVDEVASCEVYPSCEDARRAGGESGVYLLVDPDDAPHSVWCDMATDGGGWALVANSRGAPPPDQRTAWHTDLQGPLPTEARSGVWPGLRPLGLRHDIRFTCGAVNAEGPAVDIVFYDVPWYRTITAGSDRDSCFSEADGAGALERPAIRRDLSTGAVRARGQGRLHPDGDWLEGEDACGSMDDFAVDFDGRGLEAPASPTAWGLFDGEPRCGTGAVGEETGWQVWVRPPRQTPLGRVGLLGPAQLATPLADSGFAVELLADDLGDLARFDVIFLGRWSDAWAALPADAEPALDAFVRGGGALVTEFDGAALLATGYDLDFTLRLGAPDPWGWLPMTVGGGGLDGLQSFDVQPDGLGDPIVRSLPAAIVGQRGPAYFVWPRFDGQPPGRVVTTSQSPVGGEIVSTLRVTRCGGTLLMNGGSYADAAEEAVIGQFVRNLAGAAASPGPAGVADVCPD